MKRHLLLILIYWLGLITAPAAFAQQAKLMMFPTQVIFTDKSRSQRVTILNNGDATGTYEISWLDMAMTEQGGLEKQELSPEWSIQPFIRFSPRRVTLTPGESQVIKIALRKPANLSTGEYFSHLRVLTLNDNVGAPELDAVTPGAVNVKARMAMTIPVIWRHGNIIHKANIDNAQLDLQNSTIDITISRIGDYSTRGFVHIVHQSVDGSETPIANPLPMVIYANLERRQLSVPLNLSSEALQHLKGTIKVLYSTEQDHADTLFAGLHIDL